MLASLGSPSKMIRIGRRPIEQLKERRHKLCRREWFLKHYAARKSLGAAIERSNAGDLLLMSWICLSPVSGPDHSENGAARGIRTPDPVITNDVLYQLSYCGEPKRPNACP